MPLPTDSETLKIPAFMRKRSLALRQRKPLILTALDRKRAGMPPEGIKKKEKAVRRKSARKVFARAASVQELPFFDSTQCEPTTSKKITPRKITSRKHKIQAKRALHYPEPEIFSPPIIDTPAQNTRTAIGTLTHYYDKIKVGVIKITGKVFVGDCISYETADGENYEQIIESIEINRQPVFNAKKGDDIGIKLLKTPRIDSKVFKI